MKIKFKSIGLNFSIAAMLALSFTLSLHPLVSAKISDQQRQLYLKGIKYFNHDIQQDCIKEGADAGVGGNAIGGGNEKQLMISSGMAPEWADLITRVAVEQGVDPLAMGSLTFVEHGSFLPWNASGRASPSKDDSDSYGRGPWAITRDSWSGGSDYSSGVYNYEISTRVAAGIIKNYGGKAGGKGMGSIEDDFGKGVKTGTVAELGKNYNGGPGTYRNPGVAKHNQPGRVWYAGKAGDWAKIDPKKPGIIDNYVVVITYVYFHIAQGKKLNPISYKPFVAEALSKQAEISAFNSGSGGGGGTGGTTKLSTNCVCDVNKTADVLTNAGQKVVVLDPGHSLGAKKETDPTSGVVTQESGGAGKEMQDTWDATQKIKTILEGKGYKVILTKNDLNESIGHLTRVQRADAAKADIAVSMHYDGSSKFGVASNSFGVTPQEVGRFRENVSGGQRKTFDNKAVADKSKAYAQAIAAARTAAGDPQNVVALTGSFPKDRGLPAWGDIPNVMLFSNTPWVYNEGGAIGFNMDKYATGIANGIMQAVPSDGSAAPQANPQCNNTTVSGNVGDCVNNSGGKVQAVGGSIVQTAMIYAWPTKGHGKNKSDAKPEYQAAKDICNPKSVGTDEYSDCGVFVATTMIASGADPSYPVRGTAVQYKYVQEHPEKYEILRGVNSESQVQPGDIFIVPGHTYLYVGPQNGDIKFNAVSASLHGHVPERSVLHYRHSNGPYIVARLKAGANKSIGINKGYSNYKQSAGNKVSYTLIMSNQKRNTIVKNVASSAGKA